MQCVSKDIHVCVYVYKDACRHVCIYHEYDLHTCRDVYMHAYMYTHIDTHRAHSIYICIHENVYTHQNTQAYAVGILKVHYNTTEPSIWEYVKTEDVFRRPCYMKVLKYEKPPDPRYAYPCCVYMYINMRAY